MRAIDKRARLLDTQHLCSRVVFNQQMRVGLMGMYILSVSKGRREVKHASKP